MLPSKMLRVKITNLTF